MGARPARNHLNFLPRKQQFPPLQVDRCGVTEYFRSLGEIDSMLGTSPGYESDEQERFYDENIEVKNLMLMHLKAP
jgi:hypothetical protein